ncbi:C4-dicarboxylate transport sensor protein DctB [Caulifigura coniformis]|uniref:histidine kinase n=2 Tax=Caulifigura coniformis TaxID=2527983 RepID=A0A517S7A9_9PLAN|nr:C4-dicarboxylate transport sensor protein DctB [Caulifigura coniformis]
MGLPQQPVAEMRPEIADHQQRPPEFARLVDRLVASERMALVGQATAQVAGHLTSQLAILPLIQLMEKQYSTDPEMVEFLGIFRESFHAIHETVQQLRRIVRFESLDAPAGPVSLAESIRELTHFLRFQKNFPWSYVRLDLRTNPIAHTTRMKVHHILVNLLYNAADAIAGNPDGTIIVRTSIDGGMAKVTVEDNGRGIPSDDLDRIWEPSFTTKSEPNHGLGLHLVRQFVTSDGGSVSCTSTPGVKTVFTVRMPMTPSLLEQLGSDPDDLDAALSGGTSGRRLFTRASRLR